MLYSCTHMATVGIKGLMRCGVSFVSLCLCLCCQLLRQLSVECYFHHRPLTVTEPETIDDHYMTVDDPTTAYRLLARHDIPATPADVQPRSPGAGRPVSGSGVLLRVRRRRESGRESVILLDKQQMNRRAKQRPAVYRRQQSTPSQRAGLLSPPSVSRSLCLFFIGSRAASFKRPLCQSTCLCVRLSATLMLSISETKQFRGGGGSCPVGSR